MSERIDVTNITREIKEAELDDNIALLVRKYCIAKYKDPKNVDYEKLDNLKQQIESEKFESIHQGITQRYVLMVHNDNKQVMIIDEKTHNIYKIFYESLIVRF